MLGKFGLFDVMTRRLGFLSERQAVLAQNVANADTPGYIARDIGEESFRRMLAGRSNPTRTLATNASHMRGTLDDLGRFRAQSQRERYETTLSGNSVVVEEQLSKVSETRANHAMVSNLYNKYARMFRMALSGQPR